MARSALVCARCDTPAHLDATFCHNCGSALSFPAAGHPTNRVPWGFVDILKVIGLIVVGIVAIVGPALGVAALVADDVERDPDALVVTIGANFIWQVFIVAAVVFFSVRKYKVSWSALGFRWPRRGALWLPPLVVVASWTVLVVYFAIVTAIGGPDINDQEQIPDEAFESAQVIPFIALVSLAGAPVSEEVFFRGFMFQGLRSRWGILAAAGASGLLFGVVHVLPIVFIPFAIIGILFALSYVYSDSLYVPMAAHFLFNGISLLINVIAANT